MAPWYVHHKPGKGRRKESFVNYYLCAQQIKGWKNTDHKNLILANKAENWVLDQIRSFAASEDIVLRAIEHARQKCESNLEPEREKLSLTRTALQENQNQIDQMLASIASGKATGALLEMLNERATKLHIEREQLNAEQRQLAEKLQPLQESFDANAFQETLMAFGELAQQAEPEEIQRMLRLMVKRIEWGNDGTNYIEYYAQPRQKNCQDWFKTTIRSDGPDHRSYERPILELGRPLKGNFNLMTAAFVGW
jgi:hypothetical protein